MIILYVLLVAYILAINFYAFMLVKTLRDKDREEEVQRQGMPLTQTVPTVPQRYLGKLLITGALGGAITIYVCMFIFKWRRTELILMILMPLLGVLNIYLWILLFRSGFRFFVVG
jgi:hypothetical protein